VGKEKKARKKGVLNGGKVQEALYATQTQGTI